MVRPSGLEPPTPTLSRWCSNPLNTGIRSASCQKHLMIPGIFYFNIK